jgi:sarcosine oxidase delta subunit
MCDAIKTTLKYKIKVDAQMKFYETMELWSGICGCEKWVVVSRDENRLQTAEMRFLRSVIVTTIRDTIRNDDSRNKLCIGSLNGTVNKCRERWKTHVQRMTENRSPRQMVEDPEKMTTPNWRSRNRTCGRMLHVEREALEAIYS